MVLQVQLAGPHRRVGVLLLGRRRRTSAGDSSRPAACPRGRRTGGPARPSPGWGRRRRRRTRRAAASATPAPRRGSRDIPRASSAAGHLGVVGVGRREVREDPGAVDALPPEGVVREVVGLVPATSSGVRNHRLPARRAICGQRRRCSRTSRAATPRRSRRRAPRGRTACRARAGGPSPRRRAGWCRTRPTCRRPARTCPAATAGPDPLEQLGVVLLGSRRTAAPTSRRSAGRGAPRRGPATLAKVRAHLRIGLAHRPQPGRVDVRVARRPRRGGRWRWPGAESTSASRPAGGGGAAGDVVHVEAVGHAPGAR